MQATKASRSSSGIGDCGWLAYIRSRAARQRSHAASGSDVPRISAYESKIARFHSSRSIASVAVRSRSRVVSGCRFVIGRRLARNYE
ncbi:MAG TPA: hypothetical protein VFK76_00045 [Gaiellaceae bacterium]|nr:hypothetical protein [Gaiellaceae bacterium]